MPQLHDILDERYCMLYLRNMLTIFIQSSKTACLWVDTLRAFVVPSEWLTWSLSNQHIGMKSCVSFAKFLIQSFFDPCEALTREMLSSNHNKDYNRAWQRVDEIVAAKTTIGYALQRFEDTSIYMGDVERRLAKLHEETTENNELLEETFMVQKETMKPWRR